jgi:hypothetical protein
MGFSFVVEPPVTEQVVKGVIDGLVNTQVVYVFDE